MNEPNRTQFQIRCTFNGYCKAAFRNEAVLSDKIMGSVSDTLATKMA